MVARSSGEMSIVSTSPGRVQEDSEAFQAQVVSDADRAEDDVEQAAGT